MERLKKRENKQNQKNYQKNKRYSKKSHHKKEAQRYNQPEEFLHKRETQNDIIVDNNNYVIESVNPYFNQNICKFEVLYNEELLLYLLRFLPISSIISLMGTNHKLRHFILHNLEYIIDKLDYSFPINGHFKIVFQKPDLQRKTYYDRVIKTYLLLTNKPKSMTSTLSDRVKACSYYLEGKPGFYHCQKKNVLFDNYSHRKYHCFCHQISFSYFYDNLIKKEDIEYGTPLFDLFNDNKFCYYCQCVYALCSCRGNNDYDDYYNGF